MTNLKNKNLISLREATKFCSYSQEYLSLRARNGKLKSVKIGRVWFTTREWLDDYLVKVEKYKESLNLNKNKEVVNLKKEIIRPVKIAIEKKVPPPLNLPIKDTKIEPLRILEKNYKKEPSYSYKYKAPYLKFGFIYLFTLIVVSASVIFNINSFKNTLYNAPILAGTAEVSANLAGDIIYEMGYESLASFKMDSEVLIQDIKDTSPVFDLVLYSFEHTNNVFLEYCSWMGGNAKLIMEKFYRAGVFLQSNLLYIFNDILIKVEN